MSSAWVACHGVDLSLHSFSSVMVLGSLVVMSSGFSMNVVAHGVLRLSSPNGVFGLESASTHSSPLFPH